MTLLRPPLALLAGLLMPLGFAPFSQAWAPVVGLALIFSLLAPPRVSPGRVLLLGYLFGLGFAGFGVYWIHHSIANYGGGPLAAGIAIGVLVALFALIPMLALLLGWWAGRHYRAMALLVVFPAAWVLVEWVRSWLFTGATWLSLGYTQVDTPLAAYAPVLGVYGLSAAVALLAGALAWWGRRPLSLRVLAPTGMAVVLGAGAIGLDRPWSEPTADPLTVAMIQGSIPQSRKWDPAESGAILAEYEALTRDAFGADLIVWPETRCRRCITRPGPGWRTWPPTPAQRAVIWCSERPRRIRWATDYSMRWPFPATRPSSTTSATWCPLASMCPFVIWPGGCWILSARLSVTSVPVSPPNR